MRGLPSVSEVKSARGAAGVSDIASRKARAMVAAGPVRTETVPPAAETARPAVRSLCTRAGVMRVSTVSAAMTVSPVGVM